MNEPSPAEQFEAWLKANPPAPRVRPQPTFWDRVWAVLFYTLGAAFWIYVGAAIGARLGWW